MACESMHTQGGGCQADEQRRHGGDAAAVVSKQPAGRRHARLLSQECIYVAMQRSGPLESCGRAGAPVHARRCSLLRCGPKFNSAIFVLGT